MAHQAAFPHLADFLHHRGHLFELLEQPIHILDRRAGSFRDAPLSRGIEELGITPFLWRHRLDDGFLALEHALVDLGIRHLLLHFSDPGQHAHDSVHAAHAADLAKLLRQVVEIESALAHLLFELGGIFFFNRFGRPLDQADDVAHAQDAGGDSVEHRALHPCPAT